MSSITLKVNGATHTVDIDPSTPLLYILRNDLGMQAGHVPAPRHLREEVLNACRMLRGRREIAQLVGVLEQVVELIGISRRMHEFVAAPFDHHQGSDRSLSKILADDLVLARGSRELRCEAIAIQPRGIVHRLVAGEFAQGR